MFVVHDNRAHQFLLILQAGSDDNIVMTTLFSTIEDGNLEGTEKLIEEAKTFDINQANKVSETFVNIPKG